MILLEKSQYTVKATSNRGRGLFAAKPIAPGTVIADYLGKIIRPEDDDEADHGGLYGLCWRDDFCILPDIPQNGAHLINHSCMPNTTLYPYKGHILFVTTRHIFPGEEFTGSYVIEPDVCENIICHHACYCDTPICKGTMHASTKVCDLFWEDFIGKKMGRYYHTNYPFGSVLTPFISYPVSLPDHHLIPVYGNVTKPALVYKESSFPDKKVLHDLIRTSGRTVQLTGSHQTVLGLTVDGLIISKYS